MNIEVWHCFALLAAVQFAWWLMGLFEKEKDVYYGWGGEAETWNQACWGANFLASVFMVIFLVGWVFNL